MPEPAELADILAAWRAQPTDTTTTIDLVAYHSQRTQIARDFASATRNEILGSVGAALFFAAVLAWRFGGEGEWLVSAGCAGIVLWAVVTLLRFRRQLQPESAGALAATGLEHYLAELRHRHRHLRSAWVWHSPLLLSALLAAAGLYQRVVHARLWSAAPLLLLLLLWVAYGVERRWRYAAQLQREIDELENTRKETSL
ncbi:MAG: hypothetical protein JNK87_22555 [Bryobacterales bacterium]|nr:hypothetical protein [Bryobacterales bacterium]